jgi:hypothetical protein
MEMKKHIVVEIIGHSLYHRAVALTAVWCGSWN